MPSGLDYSSHAPSSHASLARGELRLFDELGAEGALSAEEQRRLLALTEAEWSAWSRFLREGPLPSLPRLPDMLLRLATAAYEIAVRVDPEPQGDEAFGW